MSAATMRVAAVDEFGPPQNLRLTRHPVPAPGPGEITIEAWLGSRVVVAGLSTGGVAHLRPAQITQAIADRRAPAKTVLSLRA